MNRKNFKYAFLALLAAGLSSCASEDFWDTFDRTIDGPIDFTVGVETSPAQRTKTRGEDNPTYYAMQAGTQVRLKVDGTWERKAPKAISKTTTCSVVAAQTGNVNTMSFTDAEAVYWDDYGAGDPENKTNTDKGVAVLGVAVDGMNTAPTVGDGEWESLSWPVITDGKDVLNGDIIVSNNLSAYKFTNRKIDKEKNLVFTHPLSKITFNLTAGHGFPSTGVGATTNKFENDPTLILSKATTLEDISNTENNYVITNGTVSISGGTATSGDTKAAVVAGTTSTTDKDITVIKQVVVYPGTQLGENDNDVIAVLNADNNIYYITAQEIHAAIDTKGGHTDYKTLPGYNYIINITINKTGIRTTATVTDWNVVNAEMAYPVIDVKAAVGAKDENSTIPSGFNGFDFWRSEDIDKNYQCEATPIVNSNGTTDWTNTTVLYWSHHYQHYHFRGIYPTNTTVVTDEIDNHQYVKVKNAAYDAEAFPCNFVMGMPEIAPNTMCNNPDHKDDQVDMSIGGICARNAAINLNSRYMMSQVEVNLSSSESTAKDNVDLSNAVVELVNVGTEGNILLSDRSAVVTTDAQDFELPHTSGNNYHGIIVPQTLKNADNSNKVRFRITVYSDSSKTKKDVYYTDVVPIKVKQKNSTDAAAETGKWESGIHYVYNLKITKTEIKATATLTDWTTVEAAEDVWF